jgi:hypothetical protein
MAQWYFDEQRLPNAPKYPVARWLKLAVTKHLGALAWAALFMAAIQKIKRWAKKKGCCVCISPHLILARLIMCVVGSFLRMIGQLAPSLRSSSPSQAAAALR